MQAGTRTVKVVARYQQYRALDRLTTGATRAQDGELDRRGGIVWHTRAATRWKEQQGLVSEAHACLGLSTLPGNWVARDAGRLLQERETAGPGPAVSRGGLWLAWREL